jgi:hypothetical protein
MVSFTFQIQLLNVGIHRLSYVLDPISKTQFRTGTGENSRFIGRKFFAKEFQHWKEGECGNDEQEIWEDKGSTFWFSVFLLKDNTMFSSSGSSSEAECRNNEQENWAKKGSTFWDLILLESLEMLNF